MSTGPELTTETLQHCPACGADRQRVFDAVAQLNQCESCELVFVSPRPTLGALVDYYSKPTKYDGWLSEETERDGLWRRRLETIDRYKKSGSLLDVGTGIGQFLNVARSSFNEVFGTEVSDSAMQIAKKKYGLDIFPGVLDGIDFGGRTFDNISLFHVLEHVPSPKASLAVCRDLLPDGGTIFIAVPNDLLSWDLKLRTFLKQKRHRLPPSVGKSGIPRLVLDGTVDEIHLSQFTPKSLGALLQGSGFDVVLMALDPFFAKKGVRLLYHRALYGVHRLLWQLSGKNRYNTILAVARKRPRSDATGSTLRTAA